VYSEASAKEYDRIGNLFGCQCGKQAVFLTEPEPACGELVESVEGLRRQIGTKDDVISARHIYREAPEKNSLRRVSSLLAGPSKPNNQARKSTYGPARCPDAPRTDVIPLRIPDTLGLLPGQFSAARINNFRIPLLV
jgi:hypothetical protein